MEKGLATKNKTWQEQPGPSQVVNALNHACLCGKQVTAWGRSQAYRT